MFELMIRPAVGLVLAAAVVGCGGSGYGGSGKPLPPRIPTSLPKTPEGLAQAHAGGLAIGCKPTEPRNGIILVRCGDRGTANFSINISSDRNAYVWCTGGPAELSSSACSSLAKEIIAAGER